jgi:predicted nucleic-acid-binding protein
MRAVDTDVLVRLIARDEILQVRAAEKFIAAGAWVPVLALVEASWGLATVHGLSPKDLAQAIEMLLDHRDLVLQDAEIVAAALELFRAGRGWVSPLA